MLKCREFSHKDARNLHPRVCVKTMKGTGLNPASEECSVSNANILVLYIPVTDEDLYYGYNNE
ncbi:hypothetical protein H5410_056806 [Solanum commersonii]|uniref:Uncharacterized protein n=1 Tax=Solanum commersonii TaxID=4109 RepID=A0A9J5WNR7_SOLCO|nr:hypothetical protein H5410_056806 [Solanum commersonii]